MMFIVQEEKTINFIHTINGKKNWRDSSARINASAFPSEKKNW